MTALASLTLRVGMCRELHTADLERRVPGILVGLSEKSRIQGRVPGTAYVIVTPSRSSRNNKANQMFIESAGVFVLGVDRQGADAGAVGAWSVRSIASLSRPAPMPWLCDPLLTASRASSMIGTGWRARPLVSRSGLLISYFAHCQRVVTDNFLPGKCYVGLSGTCAKVTSANRERKRFSSSCPQSKPETA